MPKSLQSTVVAVNNVLRQIDENKLRITLVELSTALEGTGDELGRILDQGTTCSTSWTHLARDQAVPHNGDTCSDRPRQGGQPATLGASAKQFAAFLRDLRARVAAALKDPRPDRGPEALVRTHEEVLPGFLAAGVGVTDMRWPTSPTCGPCSRRTHWPRCVGRCDLKNGSSCIH